MCCFPKIVNLIFVYEGAFYQGEKKGKYKCLKTDKLVEH